MFTGGAVEGAGLGRLLALWLWLEADCIRELSWGDPQRASWQPVGGRGTG